MRSAAFGFEGAKNFAIRECTVEGFDDFGHFGNCTNGTLENNLHIPPPDPSPPDESFENVRREPPSTLSGRASGKSFSFGPRRRSCPRQNEMDSVARYLPNVCENSLCSTMFPSTFRVGQSLGFNVVGCRGGYCPTCGTTGRVISGTYDCDEAELLLSNLSPEAVGYLERLQGELESACTDADRRGIIDRYRQDPKSQVLGPFLEFIDKGRAGILLTLLLHIFGKGCS